jgi:hypothetical protein
MIPFTTVIDPFVPPVVSFASVTVALGTPPERALKMFLNHPLQTRLNTLDPLSPV